MQQQDDKMTSSMEIKSSDKTSQDDVVDTLNHPIFSLYYEQQSEKPHVIKGCRQLKEVLLRFYALHRDGDIQNIDKLNVIDVGCGAGTQSIVWAQAGHNVYGIDVSERLIHVANERMKKLGVVVEFKLGTATSLPLMSEQMDVCLLPELLEHVPDWLATIKECSRILKPGGMLYLSTSNALCPVQNEFDLPLYSWYPNFLKRICEKKAVTTHRHWVNYATYPAVNWFTTFGLTRELTHLGFECYDQFDIMDLSNKPKWMAWLVNNIILRIKFFRYLAYFLTVSTVLVAIKK